MAEALSPSDWGAAPVDGPEHWGAVSAETSPAQQMLTDFGNQGLAAGQRTTPVIKAHMPNLISDQVHENDAGEAMYIDPQTNKLMPTDSSKHVILRDPADSTLKVFARTPDTNAGIAESVGHLLGTGMGGSGAAQISKAAPAAVSAAERIGVDIPRGIATESPLAAYTAQTLAKSPAGGPLIKAVEDSKSQLQGAVGRAAEMAGGTTDAATAGGNFSNAIETSFKPTVKAGISAAYDNLSQLVDQNKLTPLTNTKGMTANIIARRAESFIGADGGHMSSPNGKAVDTVAAATRQPNGLTFDGIKGLRTHIGEMLDSGTFPEGMSQAELRGIYGGLSEDLKAAALNAGGPRAVAALERANELNKQVSAWKEGIKKVLGPDSRSGEGISGAILRMASNGPSADLETLAKARSAVPKEVWQDIASTGINKLGIGKDGLWTPANYASQFRNLSDGGRALLFRSVGSGDVLPYLDDIAKVSQKFVDRGKLANTSGTSGNNAFYAAAVGVGTSMYRVATGSAAWYEPLAIIGGLAGVAGTSKLLSLPSTAASIARWTRVYNTFAGNQTPTARVALGIASRNLANTAGSNGIKLDPMELMRSASPHDASQTNQ